MKPKQLHKLPGNCLFALLLLLLSINICIAQTNTISGIVKDEQGNGIAGATVKLKTSGRTTTTDQGGAFVFTNIASQKEVVIISFLGFSAKEIKLDVNSKTNIILNSAINTMDEVVVTGVFDKRKRIDASVAITTINSAQMDRIVPTSAADLLKNAPGVFVNSSNGEIRNSVASRGITAGSQDGSFGYEYVSMQEDGIPVTNITYFSYGPDFFLRPDATLARLEAVRGGTASVTAANAPGGIFNYVSKTGGNTFEGEVRTKYGFQGRDGGNPLARFDVDFGGPIKDNWFFNVGGFYRYDQSGRYPGYPINKGGQIKANILKTYKTGSLKIIGKYLDDRNGYVQLLPTNSFSDPKPSQGFDVFSTILMPKFEFTSPRYIGGGTISLDPSNLVKSKYKSVGAVWEQKLGDNWSITNAFRYSENDIHYSTTNAAIMGGTDLTTYALLSGFTGLGYGNYSFKDAKTGEELMSVNATPGAGGLPSYSVAKDILPGQSVSPHSIYFSILGTYENQVDEVINQFTLNKRFKNMSFNAGMYYGRSKAHRYSGIDGVALGTIQDRPRLTSLTFTGTTLGGTTGIHQVTNADGIAQANGDTGGFLDFSVTQAQYAFFLGQTWNLSPKLTFDWGGRFETAKVTAFNQRTYFKTGAQGGTDNDVKTFYNNNTLDRITSVAFDRRLNTFSFSGALNYKFNDNTAIYTRYSRGKKSPDMDVYFAANRPETVALLNPEVRTTEQLELCLKARRKNLDLFVTPFYSVLSGVPNAAIFTNADGTLYTTPSLYSKYRTFGIEIEGNYTITKNLSLKAIATFQRSKIVEADYWVANSPGIADDTKISYSGNETDNNARIISRLTPTYHINKLYVFVTWSYLGKRQANAPNVFYLPSFSNFDMGAGYNLSRKITLSANVNNLFNNYQVMSWARPGNLLTQLTGAGSFNKAQFDAAVANNTPYFTISNPPRAFYLTASYKF